MSSWLKVMAREQSRGRDPGGLVPSLPRCQHLPACTTSSVLGTEYNLGDSKSLH